MELLVVLAIFAAIIAVPVLVIWKVWKAAGTWLTMIRRKATGYWDLVTHGEHVTAHVTAIRRTETGTGSGRRFIQYAFDVAGNVFEGECSNARLCVGDSLSIVYLPLDPTISESAEVIYALRDKAPSGMPVGPHSDVKD